MGRDFGQAFPLAIRFENKIDLSLLKIAQTAMNQFGGTARGARGKISSFNQPYRQTAHRGIPRDPRSRDPTTHNHQVNAFGRHGIEVGNPRID
jgi:hypothetical protein